jgi:hypothetical protein
MAGHRHADPRADAPQQPRPAAEREQQDGHGQLLQHPGPLEEAVEPVAGDARRDLDARRRGQHQPAVQVPGVVGPGAGAVGQVGVAGRLALAPVAQVVALDHRQRPAHAHQRAQVHHQVVQPGRALEAAVDQPPVEADRMADQQGGAGQHD